MAAAESWVEILRRRAATHDEKRAYTFLAEDGTEVEGLTFGQLDHRARAIGGFLGQEGIRGERALLLLPPGLRFIEAFLGCLYGGVVAVPAYPLRSSRSLPRLLSIVRDARPAVALTTSSLLPKLVGSSRQVPELGSVRWLAVDDIPLEAALTWREPEAGRETLAFLQYTSGSTALPKGIMVSHGNLLHNEEIIRVAFSQTESSIVVSWLPLYHDMGLIGSVLQPLYVGASSLLMSPAAFLQRPVRWLEAISRYRATTSGGPSFAYDLCVHKISESERRGLDLSSWQVAFNGAEPVRAETLERFARTFEPSGFRRQAFYPCYGLAEATLFVSGGQAGEGARIETFEGTGLEQGRARPVVGSSEKPRRLVSCGQAWADQRIAVADPETGVELGPGEVGEIWVSGASMALGYWGRTEETDRSFRAFLSTGEGPFLRTGDLGFHWEGQLFLTGRLKDLIVLRGRNLYPQDIERTVEECHPALHRGGGAAFSVDVDGEERLIVVQEVRRTWRREAAPVLEAIRRAVAEEHEARVHEVVLIREGTLPKTSSGKVQRRACRESYLSGSLSLIARSLPETDADTDAISLVAPGREELLSLPAGERLPAVRELLRSEAASVLGLALARVEPGRPLTALGLDSVAALELQSRAESTFHVALPLAGFLEGASVEALAHTVLRELEESPEKAGVACRSPGRELPLSYGQKALWLSSELAPASPTYLLAGAGRVQGLHTASLKKAFAHLSLRHPALRTTFHAGPEGPVQQVHARMEPAWIEERAADWTEDRLRERLREEAFRPFDLRQGPLLRVGIFERGDGDCVLLLALHHLIADFWSIEVLLRDLRMLSASGGEAPEQLPPLAASYEDWVLEEREALSGARGERLWKFWQDELAGSSLRLELPTDRPRPRVQSFAGSSRRLGLDGELTHRLAALGRELGATLFTVLLAGLTAMLHRLTGQEDLVIGSPTTGRNGAEWTDLVGYCVNPVLIRSQAQPDLRFAELVLQARRRVLAALEHRDFPLLLLAERMQPERSAASSPIVQVMLTLQKARRAEDEELAAFVLGRPGTRIDLAGLALTSMELERGTTPFDLDWLAAEEGGRIELRLEYSMDLFDGVTAERLLGQLERLLSGAVAQPERRWSELPLLSAVELRQLVVEWNDTEEGFAAPECAHDLFAAWAERQPEAPALDAGEKSLGYGELKRRSTGLAHRLRGLGVGPEVGVGICADSSVERVVAVLGILQAGGYYVPLDPSYPRERLGLLVEDSGVDLVLASAGAAALLPESVTILSLAEAEAGEPLPAGRPPASGVGPANTAYVIYTSGSTGRPKGISLQHGGLVNLLEASAGLFGLGPGSRVLELASFSFDVSVWELWTALGSGGTLCLGGREALFAGREISQILREKAVTMCYLPASLMKVSDGAALPSLECVVAVGERCSWDAVERWRTGRRFFNGYGPAEATVTSTAQQVEERGRQAAGPPIGRALANVQTYVLDGSLHPVPLGVAGELCLGGVGVGRGYVGRPDLTAERFVPDAFGPPGSRLYRTGDQARWLVEGSLEFLGRLDHQVKIRGFRVEPGEIESSLAAHPGVVASVVVVREDAAGEPRLVAYVVGEEGAAPGETELRGFLRQSLPEHMIPWRFVELSRLPVTPNGKLDRRALPMPDAEGDSLDRVFASPRDQVELALLRIWKNVLSREAIGLDDNFFDLGGHSLRALQLVARIRSELGQDLSVAAVLQHPTIAEMAVALRATPGLLERPCLVPIQPGGSRCPLFCIHPIGGNVFCYVDLASHLGMDQPLYGLQSPAPGENHRNHSLEEMAASYIEAIRTVQPRGPYRIAGWSMGGVVAYEMAQQLRRQNQEVELLALVDAEAPRPEGEREIAEERLRDFFLADLRGLSGVPLDAGGDSSEMERLFDIFTANVRALRLYRPQPSAGSLILFRAEDEPARSPGDLSLGWSALVSGRVEIWTIPGDHYSLLKRPSVKILAERITACAGSGFPNPGPEAGVTLFC